MERFVVIVAGGSGARMGSEIPKQFLQLCNKPILIHTINRFLSFDPHINIVLALPEEHFETWHQISEQCFSPITLVKGGKRRFDTVKNALNEIPNDALVAIHDAVRPLVSIKTITQSFAFTQQHGNAVPFTLSNASIRLKTENARNKSLNRNDVCIIQTPQTFYAKKLKQAYNQPYNDFFTDDATVWESAGNNVFLFEGNPENIKITIPIDLNIAKILLKNLKSEI